jgi:sodium/proline symporter
VGGQRCWPAFPIFRPTTTYDRQYTHRGDVCHLPAGHAAIGWAGYKATDNLSDYILGGRSLGPVVTALSAGASDMSGWLLMGLPGAVFLQGLSASWIAIGLCLGAWLNWRFVAARLRVYTEKVGNALTLPDYFTNRFEDRSNLLRIVTALVILVFFTIYCASGVVAGARLFESMFGMDYQTALWVGPWPPWPMCSSAAFWP